MTTKTEWERKRDLAEAFRAMADECCAFCRERKFGSHSGALETCKTDRCKRMREAADVLVEWEDCPGEHRVKDGAWQKEKTA